MMDEQGDRIGVVIFKDDLPHFDGCFSLHKSYIISNAVVKNRNLSYFSAHPHFEMVFRKNTIVKEAPTPIADANLNFNFMDFKDIDINVHAKDSIDVCGILIKVKQSKIITSFKGGKKDVREITIVDKDYCSITINLWEDMAQH
ncbi:hypothetical protein ACP275_07G084400 [Erythranthe tilingii]